MKAPSQKQNASGGSTLKRLKTTLKTAGLIGPQKAAAKKAAKATATRPSALAQKADAILKSLRSNNPFELKVQKTKHDVLGRKLKGSQGRPGLTRQKGLESRKQALLSDIAKRNHVGGIVDRRIGEHDPNMTEEEKMMLRWTREKQRAAQSKKSNPFNLDDDANDFDGLTHLGKSLDDMDNFNDFGPSDDEDMDGALAREYSCAMFGGGSGDHAQKSKADVMKELIAKSKQHKAERQKIKEENEDLRLQLDSELDSIRGLLMGGAGAAAAPRRGAEDDYDMMVRELKFDKRAQPTDRTKTEEELAVEEKERLERLEKDRLRRMNGEEPGEDSELTATGGYRARRERKKRDEEQALGADDASDFGSDDELNGNVAVDRFGNASRSESTLTYSADGASMVSKSIFIKKRKASDLSDDEEDDESGSDNEEDDEESASEGESDGEADLQVSGSEAEDGSGDDKDESGSEDGADSDDSDIWSDDEDSGAARSNRTRSKSARPALTETQRTEMMLKAKEELPYTFPAPESQDEFDHLMDGRSIEQVVELMARFRKLYHPSLGPDNKSKQSKNLGFLMNYMWNLDVEEELSAGQVRAAFDKLYLTVVEMSKAFPMALAQWASDMLGTLIGPSIAPPTDFSPANLFCFKLIGNIFSVSDFHHAVITPLLLTVSSYLVRPPRSMSEAATGMFLTGFCIESQSLSKRWMPEVFNYLTRVVSVYSSSTEGHLGQVLPMPKNAHSSLLMVALRQLHELDNLYAGSLDSLPELYQPVIDILQRLPATTPADAPATSKNVKSSRKSASSSASTMHPALASARDDLVASMQQHIFDEHYSLDRKYRDDPNADVETEKLKAQYKKEKKGAIRELRRDAEFLAEVRVKEQRRKDKEYEAKMRRIEGKLGDEIGELKRMKRETKKRKLV
ncbi:nucleolar protein 14 [Catenaria anguillulae PL171]|uniref:Nucleolar protein 14 n=1 Tax=Catenaria anguillulae PL171 TaxID=765915 RepID=A0A1Y2HZI2_9FUNG|nr:nucleolar protein 14 [Catenaria anguillulae PL171]